MGVPEATRDLLPGHHGGWFFISPLAAQTAAQAAGAGVKYHLTMGFSPAAPTQINHFL